jgi:hypothetical protein
MNSPPRWIGPRPGDPDELRDIGRKLGLSPTLLASVFGQAASYYLAHGDKKLGARLALIAVDFEWVACEDDQAGDR